MLVGLIVYVPIRMKVNETDAVPPPELSSSATVLTSQVQVLVSVSVDVCVSDPQVSSALSWGLQETGSFAVYISTLAAELGVSDEPGLTDRGYEKTRKATEKTWSFLEATRPEAAWEGEKGEQ